MGKVDRAKRTLMVKTKQNKKQEEKFRTMALNKHGLEKRGRVLSVTLEIVKVGH